MSTDARVAVLERDCSEMKAAIFDIRDSLQILARLEERHSETRQALDRAFTAIEKVDKRLAEIEVHIPGLIETRKWTLAAVGVVCITFMGSITALVMK